jgi:toxin ParE1/3/4
MAELKWTESALRQLDEITDRIALDKPEAARAVARRILALADNLVRFGRLGRLIPEFPHPNFRQIWIAPCWIYYRREDAGILVLHIRRAERPFHPEDLDID